MMRIGVVGVCASGKSTLVTGLRALGYDAFSICQEHSASPHLWQHAHPDFLVCLDASLESIRTRRTVPWGSERIAAQTERLADARRHCHLFLPTDGLSREEVLARVVQAAQGTLLYRRETRAGSPAEKEAQEKGDAGQDSHQ